MIPPFVGSKPLKPGQLSFRPFFVLSFSLAESRALAAFQGSKTRENRPGLCIKIDLSVFVAV